MTTTNKITAVAAILGGVVATVASASAALNLPTQSCSYNFTVNMKRGTRNSQVMELQKVLNMYPQTTIAITGAGSMGNETNYFGAATAAAVAKFQELHASDTLSPIGATRGTGNAFGLTRAVLNQICNGGAVVVNPGTVNGSVMASLSAGQPNSVLVAGQAAAELAKFTFTGNGNVNMIKLNRTGISNNTTATNVYLYDGANRLTDSASVLTDGTVTFNSTAGLFSVNGSRTISVRADIAGGTSGQSVGVSLTGYTVAGSAASMVNLAGNNQSIAQVTLATVAFSGPQVAAASINAGQLNTTVWSQSMNVGTRAVKLHSMTFKMIGSAPMDALANVSLFIDGTKVGNSTMFDNNGRATFDMTASPMLINTGNRTVEVRADIVKGSNRNFTVSIENAADVRIEDRDVPNGFITAGNVTNNAGGLISINQGNLTINQDPAYTATQVVGGATNVVISSFQVKAYGEDVKITSLSVLPVLTGTTPAASGLNNLSLYVNGGQVGSSQNWTTGTTTFNNLGSSLTVAAGQSVIVTVKADMVTTGNTNYTAGTVSASLLAGSNNAQGIQSNQLTSTSGVTGKTLTIVSGNAAFGTTSGFSAQTINQNTQTVKLGSFTMQASNADALRVTNLNVSLPTTANSIALTSITNLTVKDGSTVLGTPIGNVSASNNFSVNVNVASAGSKVFDVYADIAAATNASTTQAGMTVTYNGLTNTTSQTSNAAGVVMTINTASLSMATPAVNATPAAQYTTAGSAKPLATFNVKSTNGASTITKLTFNLTGNGLTAITVGGVTKGIISGATSVTVDGLAIAVPYSNSGVAILVTGDFATVGINAVTSGTANTIALASAEFTSGNTTAVQALSGTSSALTLVATIPTTVKGGAGNQAGVGSNIAMRVGSITISSTGDINVTTVPMAIAGPGTVGGTVTLRQNGSAVAGVTCTTTLCTFSPATRINGTATFDVYADVTGVVTAGNTSVNVTTPASFTWDDTNVTAASLTGTLVNNYGI